MGKVVDLAGKRFGFLTALEREPERKNGQAWEARITKNGKITILYYGSSFDEACKAREMAELEMYGFTKE